jgi:hypothetical protein
MAERAGNPATRVATLRRTLSIVMLNVAHGLVSRGGSLPSRLGAVARGTRDYMTRRFGAQEYDSEESERMD